jgi:hypothetical protein
VAITCEPIRECDVGFWFNAKRRSFMHTKLLSLAAAGLLASVATGAMAQNTTAPGIQMQEKGSLSGSAGASGYAPGQTMHERGSVKGTTGASGYAPGDNTTGASVDSKTGVNAGGAKMNTDIDAGAKIK